jgi:hypothetical protein
MNQEELAFAAQAIANLKPGGGTGGNRYTKARNISKEISRPSAGVSGPL